MSIEPSLYFTNLQIKLMDLNGSLHQQPGLHVIIVDKFG